MTATPPPAAPTPTTPPDPDEIPCGKGFLYPNACSDMCGSPYADEGDLRIGHECCSAVAEEVVRLRASVSALAERAAAAERALEAMKDRDYEPLKVWIREHAPEAVRHAYSLMEKAESERDAMAKEIEEAKGAADQLVAVHNHFAEMHNTQQAAWDGWAAERTDLLARLAVCESRAAQAEAEIARLRPDPRLPVPTTIGCLCGCPDDRHRSEAPRHCSGAGGPEGGCGCYGYTPGTFCDECGTLLDDSMFSGHETSCIAAVRAQLASSESSERALRDALAACVDALGRARHTRSNVMDFKTYWTRHAQPAHAKGEAALARGDK